MPIYNWKPQKAILTTKNARFIVPAVFTAIGAAIGATIGAAAGFIFRRIRNKLKGGKHQPETEAE